MGALFSLKALNQIAGSGGFTRTAEIPGISTLCRQSYEPFEKQPDVRLLRCHSRSSGNFAATFMVLQDLSLYLAVTV